MQKKVFCFTFVAFLLFLFNKTAIAADNTIIFGPVELKESANFASQADLKITVQTQNPDETYLFNSRDNGNCPIRDLWTLGPCIGEQKLTADPAGGITHIEIINAARIFNGVIDDVAKLFLEKPTKTVWDLKAGDKTGWVTYQWQPAIGIPTIKISSTEITKTDKITVEVILTTPLASGYTVEVIPTNKSSPKIAYISVSCNAATKSCSLLNSKNYPAENLVHEKDATLFTFDISGSNLWLKENSSYVINITSPIMPTQKIQTTFMVKDSISAAPPAPPTDTAPQDAASAPAPPTNIAPQNAAPVAEKNKIPGLSDNIFKANPVPRFKNLGDFLSGILNIVFYVAIFLAFYFLVWGALSYIMAQGQKENLAKARARITWAIMGLIVTLLAFFIAKYVSEILQPTTGGLPF